MGSAGENADVAMVDGDQADAIDHICEYYDGKVDGFYAYDDWGSQKDSFFCIPTLSESISF